MKQPLQIHPQRALHRPQPAVHLRLHPAAARSRSSACNTVEHGGLKVYTTIDLKQAAAGRATRSTPTTAAPCSTRSPAAALASVDPTNGHILAIASSATYDQTKFDFPVQAERQTGSAFKVFALMTLIHDYDGNPEPDLLHLEVPAAPDGYPLDPTWSVHTAEDTYQGTINITKATTVSDNTVFAQLAADEGYGQARRDRPRDGHHLPAGRIPGRGDRRPAGSAARCSRWPTPTPRWPTAAPTSPADDPQQGRVPRRQGRQPRRSPGTRVFSDGEAYAGTQVLKTVIQERHRHRRQLRLPRRRQDRHGREPGQRLVRRLHAQAVDRGVGRLPAGQHPDGFRRLRRDAGRADLARLHAARLSAATAATSRRPTTHFTGTAFTGPHSSARSPSPTRPARRSGPGAYNNPAAATPSRRPKTDAAGSDHHDPVRWLAA